jgi:ABC-type sugar transport system ATPase subunit
MITTRILELRSLTRRFDPVLALDDIGFAVRPRRPHPTVSVPQGA